MKLKPLFLALGSVWPIIASAGSLTPAVAAVAAETVTRLAEAQDPRGRPKAPTAPAVPVVSVPFKPVPAPYATRMIFFPYQRDYIFPIKCKAGKFTNIELEPDEVITGWYPSESTLWESKASKDDKELFVKPATAGAEEMPAKLKTNKRSYQLLFSVVGEGDTEWYQRVTWNVPQGFYEPARQSENTVSISPSRPAPLELPVERLGSEMPIPSLSGVPQAGPRVKPENLNPAYRIEGEASFKPLMVFDDGKWTWIKFPPGLQTSPVMFELDANGEANILEYKPMNGMHFVPRVMPHGVLIKLDREEVRIKNLKNDCGDGVFQQKCSAAAIIGANH